MSVTVRECMSVHWWGLDGHGVCSRYHAAEGVHQFCYVDLLVAVNIKYLEYFADPCEQLRDGKLAWAAVAACRPRRQPPDPVIFVQSAS